MAPSVVTSKRAKRRRVVQLPLLDPSGTQAVAVKKKARRRRPGVKLGRRPRAERVGFVPHKTRCTHHAHHPVHISIRRERLGPSFRSQRVYGAIVAQLARAKAKGVRVVHESIQPDHLHLVAEGQDRQDLSNQMRTLFSRIARAVNKVAHRRGRLFRDRHHRVELTTPTQTRNALVYVLFNDRKHHVQNGGSVTESTLRELDGCSSVGWIETWDAQARPPPEELASLRARNLAEGGETPVSPPRTWLARRGWHERGGGPLRVSELPSF